MASEKTERTAPTTEYNSQLEWIKFREHTLGVENVYPETTGEGKFTRKFKENPLIPVGCMATLAALSYGLWCFRQGKGRQSQMMMRMRIAAQGFTIVALLGGIIFAGKNPREPSST